MRSGCAQRAMKLPLLRGAIHQQRCETARGRYSSKTGMLECSGDGPALNFSREKWTLAEDAREDLPGELGDKCLQSLRNALGTLLEGHGGFVGFFFLLLPLQQRGNLGKTIKIEFPWAQAVYFVSNSWLKCEFTAPGAARGIWTQTGLPGVDSSFNHPGPDFRN